MLPLPGVLLVLFITLKLCGVIAWSWWLVLTPLWIVIVWAVVYAVVSEKAANSRVPAQRGRRR